MVKHAVDSQVELYSDWVRLMQSDDRRPHQVGSDDTVYLRSVGATGWFPNLSHGFNDRHPPRQWSLCILKTINFYLSSHLRFYHHPTLVPTPLRPHCQYHHHTLIHLFGRRLSAILFLLISARALVYFLVSSFHLMFVVSCPFQYVRLSLCSIPEYPRPPLFHLIIPVSASDSAGRVLCFLLFGILVSFSHRHCFLLACLTPDQISICPFFP